MAAMAVLAVRVVAVLVALTETGPGPAVSGLDWQRGQGYRFAEVHVQPNDPVPGRQQGFVEMPPGLTGVTFTNRLPVRRILENNNYM